MHHEKYNYSTSTVPTLRRKMRWSCVFALLMIAIMFLEIYLLLDAYKSKIDLSIAENIVSIVTMVFALLFILMQIAEVARCVAIIKKVKQNGYVQASTLLMNFDRKTSFGNVFRLLEYILLLITIIGVVGFATYSVWNYIYSSTINYYLPVFLAVLLSTYYSSKNIENMYALKNGL